MIKDVLNFLRSFNQAEKRREVRQNVPMIHRLLMQIRFYRWWIALRQLAEWEVPPADSSECYGMQGEIYDMRDVARSALQFKGRRVTSHNKRQGCHNHKGQSRNAADKG